MTANLVYTMMWHARDIRKTFTAGAVINVASDGLDIGNKLYVIKLSQYLYTFLGYVKYVSETIMTKLTL
jgi:hypothetical protein